MGKTTKKNDQLIDHVTDLSKEPTLEQLRESMDKAKVFKRGVERNKKEEPTDSDRRYKKEIEKLDQLIKPTNVEELIKSIRYTPEKTMKYVPDQIMSYHDAARLLHKALIHFIELDRKQFVANANKLKVYRMISQYIALDPEFEKENPGFNLNKGLFIYGKIGTGKSILFNALELIFQKMNFFYHQFERISCKKIVLQVDEKQKLSAINPYLKRQWMFDDLGHEKNMLKLWGNNVNVMEEIMTERYNQFIDHGMKTHVTSNLSIDDPDEVTSVYGERVRDRFNQMFNFIYMGGESLRK